MRAARILHMLLILQNRGRMTSVALGRELEVAPRTILRDVDALTEAGLPIIVHQGQGGGIELGFNYRSRLTGLDRDEAEAMGVWLNDGMSALDQLGMGDAGRRAAAKLREAFPDSTRDHMARAASQFSLAPADSQNDPRVAALAQAVREQRIVRLNVDSTARDLWPIRLTCAPDGWIVLCKTKASVRQSDWGRINISSKRFDRPDELEIGRSPK